MSVFCLLFIPSVYFLRRAASVGEINTIWALPLGAAAVVARYFCGPLVTPGEFGLSRWMSGFVDIVGLPALAPLIACGALAVLRLLPRDVDYAGFALLWLAPLAAVHAIGSALLSPVPLIAVPLLWCALAVGIPFFVNGMAKNPRWYIVFFATLAIAALPIAAVSSWWAFFAHQTLLGFGLLLASLVPAVISLCVDLLPQPAHGDAKYLQILEMQEY